MGRFQREARWQGGDPRHIEDAQEIYEGFLTHTERTKDCLESLRPGRLGLLLQEHDDPRNDEEEDADQKEHKP